jgi:ABC-type branched-subunit amino acid transport system ATPase component
MTLLINNISFSFSGFKALQGVTLALSVGQVTGLIGPNGSGKSTLLNVVSGILEPDHGDIRLNGKQLPTGRPDLVAAAGVGRTFQIPRLASRLTVFQNMLVGVREHPGEKLHNLIFRYGQVNSAEKKYERRAWEILGALGLRHQINEYAGLLSGGQQKLLSMGILLMSDPPLILLDEPAAGVNPVLIEKQIEFLNRLKDEGRTILIIEHNMEVVTRLCDHLYVLDAGEIIASGPPQEIQKDPTVIKSYPGEML